MDFDESMSSDELQEIAFQCELKKDYVKVFAYMEKAAGKGDILAQYYLGTYYEKGQESKKIMQKRRSFTREFPNAESHLFWPIPLCR